MRETKSYILLLSLLLSVVYASEHCLNSPNEIRDKINYLKAQVICSNSDNLAQCHSLFDDSNFQENEDLSPNDLSIGVCSQSETSAKIPYTLIFSTQYQNVQAIAQRLSGRVNVNDALDFHEHMSKHKKRIVDLGVKLLERYPERFKEIDKETLKIVLEAHDNAKVTPSSQYNGRPFYKVLFEEGYGRKLNREIVDSLNDVDGKWTEDAFKKAGLSLEGLTGKRKQNVLKKRKLILKIEKIADFVDRGMSPVTKEEFGRKVVKASDSKFFLKNKKDRLAAEFLEQNYNEFTKGHEYRPLSAFDKARLHKRLLIQENYHKITPSNVAKAKLSSRAIASQVKNKTRDGLGLMSKILSSTKFLKAANAVELMGYSPSTACATLGYHDWIKDPQCKPLLALSPKVISFLGEDWPRQKQALTNGEHMCRVVETIYDDLQTNRYSNISCSQDRSVDISGIDGKSLKLNKSNEGVIDSVEFSSRGRHRGRSLSSIIKSIDFGDDGTPQKICFEKKKSARRAQLVQTCYSDLSNLNTHQEVLFERAKEFLHKNSFDLTRASLCCGTPSTNKHIQDFCTSGSRLQ